MPNQIQNNRQPGLLRSVDWLTILIYVVLMGLGWLSVCGASYDFGQPLDFFDFSTRAGMQVVWIGSSLVIALILLSIDDRFMEGLSYFIYLLFIIALIATPFFARDIKGSLSWIKIGAFSIQPAEFAKFATALCVAKVMSSNGFNVGRWRDFVIAAAVIVVPMLLIVLQKETGSALVYLSFFLMFYREGMPGCLLFTAVSAVVYFVVGVRFAEVPLSGVPTAHLGPFLVLLLIQAFTAFLLWRYTERRSVFRGVLAGGVGTTLVAYLFSRYVIPFDIVWVQLSACIIIILTLLYLALRDRLMSYLYVALFALGSLGVHYSADYAMNHIFEDHQRKRIQVLLGLLDDPQGKGYNVNQAKIAIGSGGLRGKGFLNGTQTKLKYVPEQDTDFIFCTVGEEEGFLGCAVVLFLFLALILRLIHLSERQPFAFGRIYGYCVLSIFLFHVFINVGMVLGLTPVIGIPLPFFSYGGSSLWGFTILLFIFLRIDAARNRMQR